MTWQRLDPRMLLVHPVREVGKFLPVLVGIVVAGGASGAGPWTLIGVLAPVALGVARYLTTTWRIETGRVELRRGVLDRHTLSTSVERVRTVDLTASPIHRVLGLATVVIGTGSGATGADERLELDALPRDQAAALRRDLLEARGASVDGDPSAGPTSPEMVVARFSPRWLWYAPFTNGVLVAAGALLTVLLQVLEVVEIRVTEEDLAVVDGVFVAVVVAGVALLAVLLAVTGYLLANGGFVLARQGAAWHVRRGLLTRRETSIDVARLAGVTLGEPAALRLARGRRLSAIATGLGRTPGGTALLLPPAAAATVERSASTVLGAAAPVTGPLDNHPPAARTRRYVRALLGSAPAAALPALAVAAGAPFWLLGVVAVVLAAGLLLARDRWRGLGHAFADGHVVMRSGSLLRTRDALAAGHVIGWTFRDTWFQRRAGLVTVAATTAGGKGQIQVYDASDRAAVALAEAATPGLLGQFLRDAR